MKVQFWGAAQTVTGSMHLIYHDGKKILLDCGLYQGRRKIAFEKNRQLPFDAKEIDIVILSHAHIATAVIFPLWLNLVSLVQFTQHQQAGI